jgi:asparaginyl-tRNA synthetase
MRLTPRKSSWETGTRLTYGSERLVEPTASDHRKDIIFVILADGYGQLQCVFTGDLIRTYAAMTLTQETSLAIHGEMRKVPPAQHAPLDRELHVDYFTVIGVAAGDQEAITNKVQEGADPQTLLDNRYLVLRGDKASSVMKVRLRDPRTLSRNLSALTRGRVLCGTLFPR